MSQPTPGLVCTGWDNSSLGWNYVARSNEMGVERSYIMPT